MMPVHAQSVAPPCQACRTAAQAQWRVCVAALVPAAVLCVVDVFVKVGRMYFNKNEQMCKRTHGAVTTAVGMLQWPRLLLAAPSGGRYTSQPWLHPVGCVGDVWRQMHPFLSQVWSLFSFSG